MAVVCMVSIKTCFLVLVTEGMVIKWNWDTLGMFWELGPSLVGEKFPVCKCHVSSSGENEKCNLK